MQFKSSPFIRSTIIFILKPVNEENIKLLKEISVFKPIVSEYQKFNSLTAEITKLEKIKEEESEIEMKTLIDDEIVQLKTESEECYRSIYNSLFPEDKAERGNALLEIRAGTGGVEAGLFSEEIFEMYKKFSIKNGWNFVTMSKYLDDIGGLREGVAMVEGINVYKLLKYESGVHRVQRVPETERMGRVHTSTVSIAVMPEVNDVSIDISEKDLKWEVFRAGGAGGQHVNKTNSAVRVTHLPSGISVSMQDERCQQRNRLKAMRILHSRLFNIENEKAVKERNEIRSNQIGSSQRSEKIRTFNYPQDRITDHRINISVQGIDSFMEGSLLHKILEKLKEQEEIDKIDVLIKTFNK